MSYPFSPIKKKKIQPTFFLPVLPTILFIPFFKDTVHILNSFSPVQGVQPPAKNGFSSYTSTPELPPTLWVLAYMWQRQETTHQDIYTIAYSDGQKWSPARRWNLERISITDTLSLPVSKITFRE